MNTFWKLTQNIFQNRSLLRHYIIRTRRLFRVKQNLPLFRQTFKCVHLCIASTVISHSKVEDDLHKAIEEGEASLVKLMDELRGQIIKVSKEYRASLVKQTELIKSTGDEASIELPKFRILAKELSDELSEYVIVLQTIGEMAYNHTLMSLTVDPKSVQKILKKYKELEILILHEFEENKRKELDLLEVTIANIVKQ